jgi:hypothetical protein
LVEVTLVIRKISLPPPPITYHQLPHHQSKLNKVTLVEFELLQLFPGCCQLNNFSLVNEELVSLSTALHHCLSRTAAVATTKLNASQSRDEMNFIIPFLCFAAAAISGDRNNKYYVNHFDNAEPVTKINIPQAEVDSDTFSFPSVDTILYERA